MTATDTTGVGDAVTVAGVLRGYTALAHLRLEERLARFEWLATRDTYRAMLERLYGFYVRAEPELAARGGAISGLDWERRRKTPLLVADLESLGRTPRELRGLPRCREMPRLDSPARVLGTLYVLEGATLGGKPIEQEVTRRLGLDRSSGTAFFGAYGRDVAHEWRRFGGVLEREALVHPIDEMCEAALETFAVLDRWLVT